jgi:hypothetical protein
VVRVVVRVVVRGGAVGKNGITIGGGEQLIVFFRMAVVGWLVEQSAH